MHYRYRFFGVFAFVLLFLSSILFAQKSGEKTKRKERYFSPNNDGVLDEFVIPLKISDKRYVTSWQLIITDEGGNIVRTIGNKVALPSKLSFKGFFKQLGAIKAGVEVPSSVSWNGAMDNGETAPDGTYFYYFVAVDDNGNEGKTDSYPVVIDTVPPMVALKQPADKIFGEGVKSSLRISQTGSPEDKWVGSFKNISGDVVKTFEWNNSEPLTLTWDGTDSNGQTVPDGVYSYTVSATDRAGNVSEPAAVTNIIYSGEKPATNIFLVGSQYFSPKTESRLSTIKLSVLIPVPEEGSVNRLTSWSVKIKNEKGAVCKTYDQNTYNALSDPADIENEYKLPPEEIEFDGLDDNGRILPQGKYYAVVEAAYLNGYVPAVVKSPEFILDTIKPSAILSVSDTVFGAGAKTEVKISMLPDAAGKYAAVPAWYGRIYDENNPDVSVREYDFGEFPPDFITWNGFSSNGNLAPDGKYKFELRAVDLAGNVGVISTANAFELNTKSAKVLLSADATAFNPTSAKSKGSIAFNPIVKDADTIVSYRFSIFGQNDTAVKTFEGKGALPSSLSWDGKDENGIICVDGNYTAKLSVVSDNGSVAEASTSPFAIDTVPPSLLASVPWLDFSPDGDSYQDTIPVSVSSCTKEALWKADVINASGNVVKSYSWKDKITTNGKDEFEWNGSDATGNKAPDGMYAITISSQDEAGNEFSTKIANIHLDTRETKMYVTAEYEGFSPNGDGFLDTQVFNIRASVKDGIVSWNFDIKNADGVSVRSWSDKDSANLPASITWDGLDGEGKTSEGVFSGDLRVVYKKGNRVSALSSPFVCSVKPPVLSVKTAPEYFSPDNDGENDDLFIRLSGETTSSIKNWNFVINDPNGKPFWTTKGNTSITERIIWDGLSNVQKNSKGRAERVQSAMDYPYTFTVTDSLGMTSVVEGLIAIDVLVIRDGDLLKMAVPSIIFRSDNADFNVQVLDASGKVVKSGITKEQADNNERVLKRIAEILNKFKDYKVTIQGHANRVTDNEAEETEDNMRLWGPALIPLSARRAEYVKQYLVGKGVSDSRLSTEGKGGTELVVDYKDKDNNWKNRRVEFILNKN